MKRTPAQIRKDIRSLVAGKLKEVDLGNVLSTEANILKKRFGISVKGYKHKVYSDDVKHVVRKHGNAAKETARGQIAITEKDFVVIPKIIQGKNAVFVGKNNRGLTVILYNYVHNGTYYFFEEVRTGKKELVMNTMYKRKPPRMQPGRRK